MDSSYNLVIELADRADAQHAEAILDHFANYHPAVARTETGRAELILTLPAETVAQAATTGLALLKATGHRPLRLEVLTTDDYDRRAGTTPLPDLVSVPEAADLLDISRQAVLQRIAAGTLPARQVGKQWVIARSALDGGHPAS